MLIGKCTYIVNPDVRANNVKAVETAPITTTDSHVVRLAVGNSVHNEVKHGCIDKSNVVHGEVVGLLDTQETGAVALTVLVVFVPKT